MWPFSDISLSAATRVGDLANWFLLISLVTGVISTFVIVKMGNVKETHWEAQRLAANERISGLDNETERLKADNLALQIVLLPRRVGFFGLNETPKAAEWFKGLDAFAGTAALIQAAPDAEALNLANEIALVITKFGWNPQIVDEARSHVPPSRIMDGVRVSYPTGKPWTKEEPEQPWFAWSNAAKALADALTRAGLAVGDRPVSRYGFSNKPPEFPITSEYFDPPLEGVYVQVGARPVTETIEWIKAGRPDALGKPAPVGAK